MRFMRKKSVTVDKLWESLWVSVWESCGKNLKWLWEKCFCTYFSEKVEVLHVEVEKFCQSIYTWNNRCREGVLHSFHIAYYYYY